MDSAKEYKVKFDQYVEVSDDTVITNTMKQQARLFFNREVAILSLLA